MTNTNSERLGPSENSRGVELITRTKMPLKSASFEGTLEGDEESSPTLASRGRSFLTLAVLLWAACTLPTTALMLQSGRVFGEATPYTPGTHALRYALMASVLGWSLVILARKTPDLASRPLGLLFVVAFAIFYPAGSAFFHGRGSADELFTATVSLILVFALFAFRIEFKQLSIVGALGAVTGALSLGMAILRPESAYTIEQGGRALAGPFNNSNYLGTVLILSLPFVLLIGNRLIRLACLVLTVLPILMGGSRTSVATLGAILAVSVILIIIRNSRSRASFMSLASLVAFAAMILLPFSVSESDALTGRGAIWLYARSHVFDYVPFGAGRHWFADSSREIGFPTNHAHHLLLDPLIVGGLPYLGIVLTLLIALIRFGIDAIGRGNSSIPTLFTLALVISGGLGNFFILDIRDLRFTATGFVIISLLSISNRAEPQVAKSPQLHVSRPKEVVPQPPGTALARGPRPVNPALPSSGGGERRAGGLMAG